MRVVAAVVLLVGPTLTEAASQEPDSVVRIEPILVRVLSSSIGTETPYPVSVVAGRELSRGTASAFLEQAVRAVPGLQIQNRFNFAVGERVAIRGFGARSQFGVRGVRVLVDGIPATLPDGQATLDHLDLAGLGRVEALRGPAASLYGNAAGGVLHFRSADPATVPAYVRLRYTGGSFGLGTFEGSLTGTAGGVGYRVGASGVDFDGYRYDPVADDGSAYGSAKRYVINGSASMEAGRGTLRFIANGVDLDAENPGSLPQDVLDEGDRAAWGFNVRSGAIKEVRQGQLGAAWDGGIGGLGAEFAGWFIRRELDNPIPGRVIDLNRNAGGMRALVRGEVDAGSNLFSWGAGAEAELQSDDRLNFDNDGGERGELILDQHESVRGAGVFVQARFDIGERVGLLAGVRYDNVDFSVDDFFTEGGDSDDSGSRSMDAVSPSGGIVVTAGNDLEFFGSVAQSFETPTTTELANQPSGAGGFNPDLEPQKGLTFEGGARGTIANRVGVEASVFRTNLEDGLVPFEAESTGRTYFRNAGEAHHTGWEVSVDGRLGAGIVARVAYTNIDAVYDMYTIDSEDFSGNAIPGLAPQRLDALVMATLGSAFFELRGLWQDDVPVDDAGTEHSPSYFVTDVRLGFDDLDLGGVAFSPFFAVANLFDETYNTSVVPNAFGSRYFEPGPTRNYRLGLAVGFGG